VAITETRLAGVTMGMVEEHLLLVPVAHICFREPIKAECWYRLGSMVVASKSVHPQVAVMQNSAQHTVVPDRVTAHESGECCEVCGRRGAGKGPAVRLY
jgi:hypothetical protein